MNPCVASIQAEANYRLRILFTNGERGVYDCSHLLNFGVFRELRDVEYFGRVAMTYGTASWPHEQDICPDTLYDEAVLEQEPPNKTLPGSRCKHFDFVATSIQCAPVPEY